MSEWESPQSGEYYDLSIDYSFPFYDEWNDNIFSEC